MDERRMSGQSGRSTTLPWLLLLLVLCGVGVYTFRNPIADFLKPPTSTIAAPVPIIPPAPTTVSIVVTSSSILQKISQVRRLETVEMKISTVVTSKQEGTALKLWQDAQTVLLIGEGTVTAGINLEDLSASAIEVSPDSKTVRITLPPPVLLAVNLQRTQTYDVKTGLFGVINLDPKLLDQARIEARAKLQTTACESDILKQATVSSKRQMESLITMLGMQAVVLTTPANPCPSAIVE